MYDVIALIDYLMEYSCTMFVAAFEKEAAFAIRDFAIHIEVLWNPLYF